jgi:hypothetical protein
MALLGVAAAAWSLPGARAAVPFDSARVTVVENRVSIGALAQPEAGGRTAKVSDVVREKDFLSTETDSRAELEFKDNSLVRVGQNTIFSFNAESRALALKKGSMLFYVPPGAGGGEIRTPSLTAAITGTVAKLGADRYRELMAVLHGELKTKYGKVPAGYAIEWVGGRVRIFQFDTTEARSGKLYHLAGRALPEEPEFGLTKKFQLPTLPDLHPYDLQDATQVNPRVIKNLGRKPDEKPEAPKPETSGTHTPYP